MSNLERILVIDDEDVVREIFQRLLKSEGYQADFCTSGEDGLKLAREREYDAVILDVMMNGLGGLGTLQEIRKLDTDTPVIMITAYASLENAIECMKHGAFDYITKPFKNDAVLLAVDKAVKQRSLIRENKQLKSQLKGIYGFENIVGHSEQMRKVFDLVSQVAPSRSTILITGESGTGKELIAKAIHFHSSRSGRQFVVVNSGSLPPDLLESNLFGHLKGSFTGAISSKKGLFEVADGGSIFFDEIGNISLDTQAKLLRVIQEKEFMRVGGVETVHVDVRIIAATNSDLLVQVRESKFREDLYYRLNVISIQLPCPERPDGRRAIAGAALCSKILQGKREAASPYHAAGPECVDGLCLARQRARAGERDRKSRCVVPRRFDHRGLAARYDPRPRTSLHDR